MMSRHETHASCSPLHIEGTAPGDTLVVWILKLAPNRDVAISNVAPTGINAEWLEPGHLLRRGRSGRGEHQGDPQATARAQLDTSFPQSERTVEWARS